MGVQLRVRRLGTRSRPWPSCGGRRSRSHPSRAPRRPGRRSDDAPPAPAPSDRPSTARPPASCAASICSRCHGSPSAHTTDTDFGALNVTSIPPPREPSDAGAGAATGPSPGRRPSINAMNSAPSTGASGSIPSRASVSGSDSQRPGASVSSPSGSGSSRPAPARSSCPPDSGRSHRPVPAPMLEALITPCKDPERPRPATQSHSDCTGRASGVVGHCCCGAKRRQSCCRRCGLVVRATTAEDGAVEGIGSRRRGRSCGERDRDGALPRSRDRWLRPSSPHAWSRAGHRPLDGADDEAGSPYNSRRD